MTDTKGPNVYYSVVVRPANGATFGRREEGELEVVGLQHIDLVVDTKFRRTTRGLGKQAEEYHDPDILNPHDPVEGAVGDVWEQMSETGSPDPLTPLFDLFEARHKASHQAQISDQYRDWEAYDEACKAVAEYVEAMFGYQPPEPPAEEDTAQLTPPLF